ncbi:substrate-binding periplasmic protein [Salidesulfovibrio brasiliensis]|uniref:substrate-binding periplasmic protein n=1 Tax=Salidesulfovibrio brasiliensis TaxID=221711 RepID=UPI0006D27FEE|nr:transporter substrate-binding domain-containing protein [Salidesulfovibrio brasiliensis]
MRWFVSFLLTLTLWASPAFSQEAVRFATVEWQPYAGEYLPEHGIGSAIIAEACKRAGIEATFHFLPWKRAMAEVATGKYDALYSAYDSKSRRETYAMSKPYLHGQMVLCARKDKEIHWDGTVDSLRPYSLGVVLGYVNTPAIDKAHFLQKDTAPSDLLNLTKLLKGRLDLVVIDLYQAIYLLKNSPVLMGGVSDVKFLSPALEKKGIHVMFSKANPGWEDLLERFNKGLEQIEEDGTKDAVMAKLGFIDDTELE